MPTSPLTVDTPRLGAPPSESLIEWARVVILGLLPSHDQACVVVAGARQRGREGDVDTIHVRVVGPPHAVSRVIGKGGATFSSLRHMIHRAAYVHSLHVRLHVTPLSHDLSEET